MKYRRFRHAMHRPTMVMLLLLFNFHYLCAEEGLSKREERRKIKPAGKLIKLLERPEKQQQKQPERVLNALGVKKGESVADLGAGTGLFSFYLAAKVGVEGKVYAVEIEDELLDYIRNKMETDHVPNIILVKSSESDSNLPPASCDKILTAGAYYYFSDPVKFMDKMRKALKPGGLLAIIDLDAAKVDAKRKLMFKEEKLSLASEVIEEMKRAGLVLRESHDFLAQRFFLVFSAVD